MVETLGRMTNHYHFQKQQGWMYMSTKSKKVVTPTTWNREERQKDKILTQAEQIAAQQKRIMELM